MPLNIDWQQILLHLLNFAILAFGLYFLLYKPVKAFMEKREEQYREREEKTAHALAEAERKSEEYSEKLAKSEEEISRAEEASCRRLEELRAEKMNQIRAEADALLAEARGRAEEEKRKALEAANAQIKEVVSEMTEKVLFKAGEQEAYEQFLSAAESGTDGQNES